MNRKLLIWAVIGLLVAAAISGCTANTADDEPINNTPADEQTESTAQPETTAEPEQNGILNTEGLYPITKEPITISMVTGRQPNGGDAENMWFFKWIKEKTNIEFEVTRIDESAWIEQKNILFASGNLPDIFLHSTFTADDISKFGQVGKQFIPLNDLIDAYAPNIKKVFEEKPEVRAAVTSPDGNIYSLPSVFEYQSYNFPRTWIHSSWLEQLNLEEPETLDDLYNVLKAFKDGDPNGNGAADEIPFSGSWEQGHHERTIVLAALGFNTDAPMTLSVKDGRVLLPEADPLYAEYLKFMHTLNVEGLMDKEIFTQTQVQAQAKASQNIVGLMLEGAPNIISPDHWQEYSALKPLVSEWNQDAMWPDAPPVTIGRFMITREAEHPEAAIRFADLFFTEEFSSMFWTGPKKGSADEMGYAGWTLNENNQQVYEFPEGIANNFDYFNYLSPINGYKLGIVYDAALFSKVNNVEVKLAEAAAYWRSSMDEKVVPHLVAEFPAVYLSEVDSIRSNELYTPISDYIKTMEAKFITGNEPLTAENLDNYFNELKQLGVEEYVQIYQNAYNDYAKSLN